MASSESSARAEEDQERVVDVPANPVLQLCPGETTAQRVPGLVEANPGDRRADAERAPVTVHRQLADRGYVDLRSAAERGPQCQVGANGSDRLVHGSEQRYGHGRSRQGEQHDRQPAVPTARVLPPPGPADATA